MILIKRGSINNSPFAPFVTFASRGVHVGITTTHDHNRNHNTMASKRSTNMNKTNEVRIALCEHKKKHPSLMQADLITWLQETLMYSQSHRLSCWVRSCLCSDSGGNCAGPLQWSCVEDEVDVDDSQESILVKATETLQCASLLQQFWMQQDIVDHEMLVGIQTVKDNITIMRSSKFVQKPISEYFSKV